VIRLKLTEEGEENMRESKSIQVQGIPSCGANSSTFSEQIRFFSGTVRKYLICSLKVDEFALHEGIGVSNPFQQGVLQAKVGWRGAAV
jgi:hypothetical protein